MVVRCKLVLYIRVDIVYCVERISCCQLWMASNVTVSSGIGRLGAKDGDCSLGAIAAVRQLKCLFVFE